jgi:peptidoglycan/xylan/chitin deacetylase (PgdA/CDA1 family)
MNRLVMTPETFDAQMRTLSDAGWHTITLGKLAGDLATEVTPPAHTFVVTIDDGWWDGYTYAYPILARYGFVATFFVIGGRIGQPSFLSPAQILSLVQAGNEIGDHTWHHATLTGLQPKPLASEIDSGAAMIAAVTGSWPVTLAYPRGKTDTQVIAAVAACKPLQMAVVEGGGRPQTWANRYDISRLEVWPNVSGYDLLVRVRGLEG